MDRVIFYFDAVLSMRQRVLYGLWGGLMVFYGFEISSDNPEIGFLFWGYVVIGVIFVISVLFQPYLKKVFGRRYVMFHNEGITWKLAIFGEEQSINRSEIQFVYFHPTSLDIRFNDGTTKQFRFPEIYTMAQDFREKALRWVRALDIPWEDWREHRKVAS